MTAQNVKFAPSGRYFAVLSDSDYIIYAYPKFSNVTFGQATDLVWSSVNSSQTYSYACRTENGTVKVFQNFAEFKTFKTSFSNDGIFGGRLLAIKSKEFITFYDWEEFHVIRRIDVASAIKQVIWSDDGKKVIIGLEDTFYLL
jgi:coatomer subunit beta'